MRYLIVSDKKSGFSPILCAPMASGSLFPTNQGANGYLGPYAAATCAWMANQETASRESASTGPGVPKGADETRQSTEASQAW